MHKYKTLDEIIYAYFEEIFEIRAGESTEEILRLAGLGDGIHPYRISGLTIDRLSAKEFIDFYEKKKEDESEGVAKDSISLIIDVLLWARNNYSEERDDQEE